MTGRGLTQASDCALRQEFLKLTLGEAKGTSVPREHRSQQAPSCLRAKDSACRCFTSPLQLREKNMVDRFPTFTEQRNLFLLLVCSLSGGFS